jgi:hypothetical protein
MPEASSPAAITTRPSPARDAVKGSSSVRFLDTTDPKDIGSLYLVTSFAFFIAGGAMAMLMRAELARLGTQFLSPEQYNQLFTLHATIMLLLYATPIRFGFASYILPLQIGSPDVASPRLNPFTELPGSAPAPRVRAALPAPGRLAARRGCRAPLTAHGRWPTEFASGSAGCTAPRLTWPGPARAGSAARPATSDSRRARGRAR